MDETKIKLKTQGHETSELAPDAVKKRDHLFPQKVLQKALGVY